MFFEHIGCDLDEVLSAVWYEESFSGI